MVKCMGSLSGWMRRFGRSKRPSVCCRSAQDWTVDVIQRAEETLRCGTLVGGVATGLRELDRKLGGLRRAELILLAGRPKMGKKTLARTIAVNAAKVFAHTQGLQGARVVMFCLANSAEQVADRILASETGVAATRIWIGDIKASDLTQLERAQRELISLPLCLVETPSATVDMIRRHARLLTQSGERGLVIVDCMERLRNKKSWRSNDRSECVERIVAELSATARQFDLPIMIIADLSDTLEVREDKRPRNSDLHELGEIYGDLDLIIFLYRRQYYLERSSPECRPDERPGDFNARYLEWADEANYYHNKAECIIAKNRYRPPSVATLGFDNLSAKFFDFVDIGTSPFRLRYRRPGRCPK